MDKQKYTLHSTQNTIINTQYTTHATRYILHTTQYKIHNLRCARRQRGMQLATKRVAQQILFFDIVDMVSAARACGQAFGSQAEGATFFFRHCGHGLGCACLRPSGLQPSRGRERIVLDLMLATSSSCGNCATAYGNWPLLLGNGQRAKGNGNGQRASWERLLDYVFGPLVGQDALTTAGNGNPEGNFVIALF